jgi:HEPN domain-containing protein
MSGEYSYIDIARDDLVAAKSMLRDGLYNHAARLCQQYVEKAFKECIKQNGSNGTDQLLLQSHRLAKLAERCGELKQIGFNPLETAFFRELTDYYFDTNYPGVNYVKVSEQKAIWLYDKTLAFKEAYENLLCVKN